MSAPRKKASDFHPKILEFFDGFVHGRMTKREFMTKAGKYTAAGVTGAMILEQLAPNYALAQQVAPDDPAIETMRADYDSPDGHGAMYGLLAMPAERSGPLPGVVVIHENRGLNPYIEDVVRRLAKAGYVAFGPDGLASLGGYPGTDEEGREMQRSLDRGKLMADMFAAYEFLRDHEATTKVGATGFCYGGGVVNALAVAYGDLGAAAPYYGSQPEAADVPAIEAPVQLHYAGLDERVNAGWPAYEEALKASGKTYEGFIYEGANHGFHNDTTPRYDEAAATLAWDRTLAFFGTHLS